ncbi:MAG: tRNA (adenosine(37)-N6)-threonylcarbamoyltransferase complex dimerization subunit type 1 TsaB [Oscillospiraceae bacterium]|nr:tRNA (adenosine(37)-N6)-threonylcarbamoyltransferase complex dimerization subunit type 1 TsaB [Oscillospiraceae bacterium]
MRIFAVDTSSLAASAAIIEDEVLLGEYIIDHKKTHSQKIMPMTDELFGSCELKPSDIDIYAVSVGPGSFTGLRIGIATVKALAHAVGKPVVGVGTLEAMAYNMPFCEYLLCPIEDARRSQVYNAAYKWNGGVLDEVKAPNAAGIDECISGLGNETVMFIGDGIAVNRDFITDKMGDNALFAPAAYSRQRASSVAQAAYFKARDKSNIKRYTDILPVYLRKSQAEREYEERERNGK